MIKKQTQYKTQWDLSKPFYTSLDDPRLQKDIEIVKAAFDAFEKKYKNSKKYLEDTKGLKKALDEYTALQTALDPKPLYYIQYILALDSGNSKAQALLNKYAGELTTYSNKIVFFTLALGKIAQPLQKKFLSDQSLYEYHYFLSQIFKQAKHQLTEAEEKILNIKTLTSRTLWIQGSEKLQNKQTVGFKGKPIPLSEAFNLLHTLPLIQRRKLSGEIMAILRSISDFSESELNAICTDKKATDELRHFDKPYSSRALQNELPEKSIESLVAVVSKNFPVSGEYYGIKKKLLGLSHLEYPDRIASLGTIKKRFSFDESVQILRSAFYKAGSEFGSIFDQMLENGQIDVYPKKGKTGGAFCSHGIDTPTLVLLNHTNTFNDVITFGHEMGHAFHAELSKKQIPLYQHYSTAVAETASTLFERFVFDEIFERLSEKEKIIALDQMIMNSLSTIFRQIAFFNFENEMHTLVRQKGFLSKEELAQLMNKHVSEYLGKSFKLSEDDGYFFVMLRHVRNLFYVYTYAFGALVSFSLYEKYKQDSRYIEHITGFLSAGGSRSPAAIFKDMGIDITNINFFEYGIANIKNDIALLKRLTNKKK